jgi:catechol 2,3-dioxygenase-like lactoylglutathione lyase family enzyme
MAAVSSSAMAPAAVHRLGHVALRVTDMERAKAFYAALGLRLTWDAADWAYLQSPLTGDGIALLSADYKAAGPHFAFHLEDRAAVDAVHAQLAASGHPVGPVHDHRDGTASFYLQDPEGNWLEILYEPPSGIPSNTGAPAIAAPPLAGDGAQG